MDRTLFLFLHLTGVVFWIGGVVAVAVLIGRVAPAARAEAAVAARAVVARWINAAMLAAWVGGLGVLLPHFSALYAKAGWMHGKLTLALVASGLTGAMSAALRKMTQPGGGEAAVARLKTLGWVVVLGAVVVVALVMFKPGA